MGSISSPQQETQTTRGLFFIAQMSNKKPLEVFIPENFLMEPKNGALV